MPEFGGSDHRLQLSLHLTPESLDSVRVGSCIRIDKVLRVVDHEVDVAQVVEVEVRGKLVRNNRGSRCYKVLY